MAHDTWNGKQAPRFVERLWRLGSFLGSNKCYRESPVNEKQIFETKMGWTFWITSLEYFNNRTFESLARQYNCCNVTDIRTWTISTSHENIIPSNITCFANGSIHTCKYWTKTNGANFVSDWSISESRACAHFGFRLTTKQGRSKKKKTFSWKRWGRAEIRKGCHFLGNPEEHILVPLEANLMSQRMQTKAFWNNGRSFPAGAVLDSCFRWKHWNEAKFGPEPLTPLFGIPLFNTWANLKENIYFHFKLSKSNTYRPVCVTNGGHWGA